MIEYVGYTALGVSLLSINMNNMLWFRCLHLLSSSIYVIYGCLIGAVPLAVGSGMFMAIHCYKLYKTMRIKE